MIMSMLLFDMYIPKSISLDIGSCTDILSRHFFGSVSENQALAIDDYSIRGHEFFAIAVPNNAPHPRMRLNQTLQRHSVPFNYVIRINVVFLNLHIYYG